MTLLDEPQLPPEPARQRAGRARLAREARAQACARARRRAAGEHLVPVFAVCVLVLASGAFFALLGPGLPGEQASRPEILLLWVMAYAVAAAVLLDGRVRLRRPVGAPVALLAFVALAGCSVLWSESPELTARRAVGLGGTVLVGLLLAQRLSPVQLLDALRRAMLLVAVASLAVWAAGLAAALDPIHGTLRGVVATKNTLGQVMAIGLLACAALALLDESRRRRCLLSALPMLLALGLTDSTAGLLTAGLILVGSTIVVLRRGAAGRVLMAAGVTLVLGVLMVTLPGTSPERVAGVLGEDTTLTGRDVIWSQSIDAAQAHVVLGHGYGAFWEGTDEADRIRARLDWPVPHAHNGLLDVLLDLGLLGVALAVAILVTLVVRGVQDLVAGARDLAVLRLSIAALILLSNLVESAFLQQNSLLGLLLVVALAGPPRR